MNSSNFKKKIKRIVLPAWLILATVNAPALAQGTSKAKLQESEISYRVMSYNIRYINTIDSINIWDLRKANVAALISYHNPDVFGLQEATRVQVNDLSGKLPEFGRYGISRIDGKNDAEQTTIFYRRARFNLLDTGTFWLSEEPHKIGSKSWDAAYPRIASWCKFKDRATGAVFFYFNTHFDHRGEIARQRSAELIVRQINVIAGKSPVIVTGDFNATPTSIPYQNMIKNTGLVDAKAVSETPHYGPDTSFQGFFVSKDKPNSRIDYIFINNRFTVSKHAILTDQQEGRYFSDHLPVIAEMRIKNVY